MKTCPACAEEISPQARDCPHCGEPLRRSSNKTLLLILLVVVLGLGSCVCVPMIAAIAIPNLIEARKHGNEASAIGTLKTITAAQAIFREGDKEADDLLDYATLDELVQADLLEPTLRSGVKNGYRFEVVPGPDPEFLWVAVANPVAMGTTGDRAFAVDQSGVVYYVHGQEIALAADGTLPIDQLTPVGR